MCSPTSETHLSSYMRSSPWEAHIPSDVCSLPGKHISLVMCVPLPGKHLFLVIQRAKKVVSDSPGLVDFAIGLVNSDFNLPDGQVIFFWEFE